MKRNLVLALGSLMIVAAPAFAGDLDQNAFNKAMDSYLSGDQNVEKVGMALERYLQKKQQDQFKAQKEAEKQKLEQQFNNPTKVDIGDSPVRGPANAKITIVEFSDFQCPYCKRGAQTIEEVMKMYPQDVKVVFKNFPLSFHDKADGAAKAAVAAGKQGKFWEMHDKLFANSPNFSEEVYANFAKDLGINVEKFVADMKDPGVAEMVKRDQKSGEQVGIQGTPGFFVNGVQLSGAQPVDRFKELIDRWIAKVGKS